MSKFIVNPFQRMLDEAVVKNNLDSFDLSKVTDEKLCKMALECNQDIALNKRFIKELVKRNRRLMAERDSGNDFEKAVRQEAKNSPWR